MYDDDGFLLYKGIMINWKRFGYGTMVNECEWYNGIESDNEYEGDGSEQIDIRIKYLKLSDNCVLVDWDVSLLYNLESIEIGDHCFAYLKTFQIDGLNRLKTIKIGSGSFTQTKSCCGYDASKSFHILNCESLESNYIRTVGSKSYYFYFNSPVIRGIDMILNI